MKKLVFNLMFLAATIFILFQSENVYATEYYNIGTDGGEWDGNHYIIDGNVIRNSFFSDGSYTYFLMSDGTPMKDRLTYHPNGRNVIYFDKDGHEAFNNFKHVTKSISGKAVDDYCYFDVDGYMYVDRLTYDVTGKYLYYINQYGQLEHTGLFKFPDGARGFALGNGDLIRDKFYTVNNNMYYFHGNGYCAQGLITDGCWYYNYDVTGKYLGKFINRIVVIVLDPGHDIRHPGAMEAGLIEKDLTLKIAKYCKEELEKYYGVSVYLTRDTDKCPHPETASSVADIKERVNFAKSVNADAYVSIHINSSDSETGGAEVFYQNENWKPQISKKSKVLASNIQDCLTDLGLKDRGIKLNTSTKYHYRDGSLADEYAVNNNGKVADIPAIIVEHCFISSTSDRKKFLATDAGLKKLGVADAKGIAETYGLSK